MSQRGRGRSGSSGHHRGYSGGGGRGAAQASSAPPATPALSSNRSFRRSGNGQQQPQTQQHARVNQEPTPAPAPAPAPARAVNNGTHAPAPALQADGPVVSGGAKPVDARSSKPLPKAPTSAAGPDPAAPKTPRKGDGPGAFPLQFGTIGNIMNGMQIPARTSSAPPNLDEQKLDQVRHDSFRAVPTLPIPTAQKQPTPQPQPQQPPQPQPRKDLAVNSSRTGGHPPTQAKREPHVAVPSGPTTTTMMPPVHPLGGIPMPFQQFGVPGPQMQPQGVPQSSMQMTMGLPVGNAPQIPQPMFLPNIHPHLQTQAMMHQGQNLGFSPQINRGPQIGSLGIGPQFPQQQPVKFGGPGTGKNPVKITHPVTHEELRLDKRSDSFVDGKSSVQRQPPDIASQAQPLPTFPSSHTINYYPTMQPGSFNNLPYFPTSLPPGSTQTTAGPQGPRYYQIGQGGQAITFMNQSVVNPMPGGKPGQPSLHIGSEATNLEGLPVSAPSAPVKVTKPPVGMFAEKVGRPSVTITAPISKAEPSVTKAVPVSKPETSVTTNVSTSKAAPLVTISPPVDKSEPSVTSKTHINKAETPPAGVTTVSQLQTDKEIDLDSSLQQPKPGSEPSDKHSSAAPSVHVRQSLESGISSSAPVTASGDSGSVMAGTDGRRKDSVRRSESLKEQHKKGGKKDIRQSQQQQQIAVLDPSKSTKLSSSNINQDSSVVEVVSGDVSESLKGSLHSSVAELPTSDVSLPSSSVEHATPVEVGTSGSVIDQAISKSASLSEVISEKEASEEDSSVCSPAHGLLKDGACSKQSYPSETTAVCSEVDATISKSTDFVSPAEETGYKQEMLEAAEHGKAEAYNDSSLDCSDDKRCQTSTVEELPCVKDGVGNSEKAVSGELGDEKKPQDETVPISSDIGQTAEETDRCATSSLNLVDAVTVPSTSDALNDKAEVLSCQEGLLGPGKSLLEAAYLPASSEIDHNVDHKLTEMSNGDPVSVMPSAPKEKPSSESTRTRVTGGKKKKRKEILSKADAAGTSDLYNAYKGPQKMQDVVSCSESADGSSTTDGNHATFDVPDKDASANEEDGLDKSEVDDWEDAAESTPKLETLENGSQLDGDGKEAISIKYSRDFLLIIKDHCIELPMGFDIGSDITAALMSSQGNFRESYPSPGRITDRPSGGPRRADDGKWNKSGVSFGPGVDTAHGPGATNFRPGQGGGNHGVLRNPRGQPNQFGGGILSGPMQSSQGVMPRNNADASRWERATGFQRGLMPSPNNTPLQVMHKAERKYEVGKVSDQEEAKQRQLKGILNKLTPQNFERLFEQVKEVNIDSIGTLTGVISQIFDKALMEPTFCEMYANFCFHLAGALPDFTDENAELITFRRLLLNKCQEEFERGEREQAEAEKIEEEGEIKQSEQEREEKRLRARRRMLGNIRLIGELFKKKMLTERIMHECIKKLLGQYQSPDEEDIEALCKLMATIGEMIDHSKAKVHMDAYFDMMHKLSTNDKISSRVRFMLRDSIDLRRNKWQQRRKVEGPKKIEDVHRDAAIEKNLQSTRLARGPSMGSSGRRGPSVDYGSRGSAILNSPSSQHGGSIRNLPSQNRGYAQDVRFEERHQSGSRTLSVTQRHTDDSITLGPQGGLARGMSVRGQQHPSNTQVPETHPSTSGDSRRMSSGPNGHSAISDRPRSATERHPADRVDRPTTPSARVDRPATPSGGRTRPGTPENKPPSEETLRDMSISAIREFYSAKDEGEVALCIKELNSPGFYPSMVSLWVMDSFERKDLERDLLGKLLVSLCKSHDSLLGHLQLMEGFRSVLSLLEDAVNDAPRAGEFLGRIFATSVLAEVCSLGEIGRLIHEGGEEPGRLLEIGLAGEVLGSILESIRMEKGESVLADIRTGSNLRLEDFRPPQPMKSRKLEPFL